MRVNNCFSVCLQGKSFLDSPSKLSLPRKEYPKEGLEEEVVDEVQGAINFVSPDIKMLILLTVLHTFLLELVRRICLNIKTSYPW